MYLPSITTASYAGINLAQWIGLSLEYSPVNLLATSGSISQAGAISGVIVQSPAPSFASLSAQQFCNLDIEDFETLLIGTVAATTESIELTNGVTTC